MEQQVTEQFQCHGVLILYLPVEQQQQERERVRVVNVSFKGTTFSSAIMQIIMISIVTDTGKNTDRLTAP